MSLSSTTCGAVSSCRTTRRRWSSRSVCCCLPFACALAAALRRRRPSCRARLRRSRCDCEGAVQASPGGTTQRQHAQEGRGFLTPRPSRFDRSPYVSLGCLSLARCLIWHDVSLGALHPEKPLEDGSAGTAERHEINNGHRHQQQCRPRTEAEDLRGRCAVGMHDRGMRCTTEELPKQKAKNNRGQEEVQNPSNIAHAQRLR